MVTGLFPHQHGITGNDAHKYEDRANRDIPFRKAFHNNPSFIKELVKLGYLTHQSGKWWEGSYQDGGLLWDAGLKIGREGLKPITDFVKKFPKLISKMDQMVDDWLQKTSKK